MALARTAELLDSAAASGSAVLALNVITLEHAEGVVAGLERAGVAGILQVSENAIRYHGGRIGPLLSACREVAEGADVPVALHLDHLQSPDLLRAGVDEAPALGVTSLMVDAAHLDYADNVDVTRSVARAAQRAGMWVEAELGEIGGKQGAHAPGVRTDPSEAAEFAAATRVDGLAVAVGSQHAMTATTATLDLGLIERIASLVGVPLVLHGSSGVPPSTLADAVRAGIRKINVGTALNVALTRELRRCLESESTLTDPRKYLGPGRDAMATAVASLAAHLPAGRPA